MLDSQAQMQEGLRYQKLGMLEKAIEQFEAAVSGTADTRVQAEALVRESGAYRAWCKWDEALHAARRGAVLASEANLDLVFADALNAEAVVHQERGDFERAVPLYERMLTLTSDERARGLALQNLGSIAAQRADLELAEHYFLKSYGCFQRADYGWGEAFALNNLAALALDRGKAKVAEVLGGQAMIAAKKVGDLELLGIAELNLAESLAAQRQLARGERLAEEALRYFAMEENSLRRSQCLRVLGDISLMRGERSAAWYRYTDALELAESVGASREVGRIRDCLQLVAAVEKS
jgi:tetratricopeptide (TPR) repeat protein